MINLPFFNDFSKLYYVQRIETDEKANLLLEIDIFQSFQADQNQEKTELS